MPRLALPAILYLIHIALLTFALAVSALLFNLTIDALGYARSFLGLLTSVPVLAGAVLSLPVWWLVLRAGSRPALLLATLLHSAALLTVALWPQALPLLVMIALTGPATALTQLSAAPLMMRHSGEAERDLVFSLNGAIVIGVAGLGTLVGGWLPDLAAALLDLETAQAGYRAAFAAAGLCALGAALPLVLIRDDGRWAMDDGRAASGERRVTSGEREGASDGDGAGGLRLPGFVLQMLAAAGIDSGAGDWRKALRSARAVLRFLVSPLLISCGASLLIPFLNLYFKQRFGPSDPALGVIFAAINLTTGGATLLAPLLSARLGKMGSVVLTQGLAVPCLLLLGAAPALGAAVALAVVRAALMNMASPLYEAYAMEQSAELTRPTVIGLINGAFAVGYIVGPTVSALVQERFGFAPLFVATAACYSCAALCNYLIFLRRGDAA